MVISITSVALSRMTKLLELTLADGLWVRGIDRYKRLVFVVW